jgi:PTS system N-acetylglucosamine-specific IIC component
MLIPLGLVFALVYFTAGYLLLKRLGIDIVGTELGAKNEKTMSENDEAAAFIKALGGKNNIVRTDACITRLRMQVRDGSVIDDDDFIKLGAKGVIRPDAHSVQIVLGQKAEEIADTIRTYLKNDTVLGD